MNITLVMQAMLADKRARQLENAHRQALARREELLNQLTEEELAEYSRRINTNG